MPYRYRKTAKGTYNLVKQNGIVIHTKATTLEEAKRIGKIRESYDKKRGKK